MIRFDSTGNSGSSWMISGAARIWRHQYPARLRKRPTHLLLEVYPVQADDATYDGELDELLVVEQFGRCERAEGVDEQLRGLAELSDGDEVEGAVHL